MGVVGEDLEAVVAVLDVRRDVEQEELDLVVVEAVDVAQRGHDRCVEPGTCDSRPITSMAVPWSVPLRRIVLMMCALRAAVVGRSGALRPSSTSIPRARPNLASLSTWRSCGSSSSLRFSRNSWRASHQSHRPYMIPEYRDALLTKL